MTNGFSFGIGMMAAQLIFGIACYEVVRYLILNKLKNLIKKKPKTDA